MAATTLGTKNYQINGPSLEETNTKIGIKTIQVVGI